MRYYTLARCKFLLGAPLRSVHEWWPQLEDTIEATGKAPPKKLLRGLFLRGQARKRKANRAKANGEKAEEAKKQSKKKQKNKPKKNPKLKKAKKHQKIIPDKVCNYRRQGIGVILVKQKMQKAREADVAKFPDNPVFSRDLDKPVCKLKIPACQGKLWSQVLEAAHPYFKAVYLVLGWRSI